MDIPIKVKIDQSEKIVKNIEFKSDINLFYLTNQDKYCMYDMFLDDSGCSGIISCLFAKDDNFTFTKNNDTK